LRLGEEATKHQREKDMSNRVWEMHKPDAGYEGAECVMKAGQWLLALWNHEYHRGWMLYHKPDPHKGKWRFVDKPDGSSVKWGNTEAIEWADARIASLQDKSESGQ